MRRVLPAVCILAACTGAAVSDNQVWTSASLSAKPFDNRNIDLALSADFRLEPDGELETFELRPGIDYRLNERFSVGGGYLYGSTRLSGPDRIEHRTWQQLSYTITEAMGFEFSGRSRLEQCWRENFNDTGWRWRLAFGVARPVAGTPFEVALSTDLYFEINETAWGQDSGFSEARTEATLSWAASETLSVEFGYLNQYRERLSTPDQTDHHILIGLSNDL